MTLDHLDMAIAFAVVMLTVSLLITIFVQTASAACGLRGTNLRWGVDQLLRMVYPELGDRAGALADRVLQHPIISDSAVSRFGAARRLPVVGRWFNRLHYASAIRVQELVGIMDVLAGATPPPPSLSAAMNDEQRMAYIVAAARRSLEPEAQAIAAQARALSHEVTPASSAAAGTAVPLGVPAGRALSERLRLAKDDLESWFDVTMDRVSQRFVMHTRLWTVGFSIAVAFALHLDTFHLLSQLAANPDARARLAGASDTIQRVAAGSLAAQPVSGASQPLPPAQPRATPSAAGQGATAEIAPAPPLLYREIMMRELTANQALQHVDRQRMPGFFPDRVAAAEWLRGQLVAAGESSDMVETAVAQYEAAVDDALSRNVSEHEAEVRRLSDQALTMRGVVGSTGFQLVPDPYHSWDLSPWWPMPVWAGVSFATIGNLIRNLFFARPSNLHFWGILFSAGLLSLGAPFWYNALKTLSALKPIVADKEQQERQAAR